MICSTQQASACAFAPAAPAERSAEAAQEVNRGMGAASDFEFKFRFWIFGALFWLASSATPLTTRTPALPGGLAWPSRRPRQCQVSHHLRDLGRCSALPRRPCAPGRRRTSIRKLWSTCGCIPLAWLPTDRIATCGIRCISAIFCWRSALARWPAGSAFFCWWWG